MAHTDKTDPFWVRLGMTREDFEDRYSYFDVPQDFKWSWRERGSGPKGVRFAKKEARRARRRGVTHPYMVKSLKTTYKYNCS